MQFLIPLLFGCSLLSHFQHEHFVSASRLGRLNIEQSNYTITGFSTGAAQVIQFHYSHSSKLSGVGIISGPAYLYGVGNTLNHFYAGNPEFSGKNYSEVLQRISLYERQGIIDPTKYLGQSRIFIYQGSKDTISYAGNAVLVKKMYQHFGATQIHYKVIPEGQHGVPARNFGGPCSTINVFNDLVNNCKYDGVFEMYNYLYGGNLRRPPFASVGTVPLKGDLLEFDQSVFFGEITEKQATMDKVGFLYIPSGCKSGVRCRVTFALHGCLQCRVFFGERFVRYQGYLEVAELNNIIVVFPQAFPEKDPINPQCCWDWWMFTGKYAGTKLGFQTIILKRMMDRIYEM